MRKTYDAFLNIEILKGTVVYVDGYLLIHQSRLKKIQKPFYKFCIRM
jgi:hypothetical protein